MSFTFRGAPAPGVATLRKLPSFAGLQVETIDAPGTDGTFLGGTSRNAGEFVFDTILSGGSPAAAAAVRDAFAAALDPTKGEDWLTFDAAPGWRWRAILSKAVDWERLTWDAGAGYQFRGDVTFAALEAYGRPVVEESWSYPGPGAWTVTRQEGNAVSFPTVEVEFASAVAASGSVSVTAGGVQVDVSGPFGKGEVLRLDWDGYDLARWAGAVKVTSVVRAMSTLDRPVLWPGVAYPFAVSGPVSRVTLLANSRRQ